MYQGFYNLASGMLTQSRNLNTISNNMVNIQTPGYKNETMVSSTFKEEMLYRTGQYSKENPTQLATVSKIKTAKQVYTNYDQGGLEQTDGIYDFALNGNGFFCIQTSQEIKNENFTVDSKGHITAAITNQSDGEESSSQEVTIEDYGTLKVVDFPDQGQLHAEDNGLFSTAQAETTPADTTVQWKMLEKSNVDMVEQMTAMMSSQRALQSAAQSLKMYDQIMSKSVSDVGKL